MKVTQATALAVYFATVGVYAAGPIGRRQETDPIPTASTEDTGTTGSVTIPVESTESGFSDTVISTSLDPTDSLPTELPTDGSPTDSLPDPTDLPTDIPTDESTTDPVPIPTPPNGEGSEGEDGDGEGEEGAALSIAAGVKGLVFGAAAVQAMQLLL